MLRIVPVSVSCLAGFILTLLSILLTACQDNNQSQGVGWQPNVPFGTMPPGFDAFPEQWNRQVQERLTQEETAKQQESKELRKQFFETQDPVLRDSLQSRLIANEAALSIIHRRQTEGDYIQFKSTADIPKDLVWQDGLDNPEIGDPKAKKGGVLRQWAPGSYPDTFRPNGPNSNSGFRSSLYDEIVVGLVSIHPVTGKIIPGIARKWAESPDKRTVYFELDPDAAYADGAKVKAIDLLVNMYIRTSDYSRDVFYNNFFYQNASNITIYDDHHLSVTLPSPKPLLPYYCTLFIPSPPHFYTEFGPDYIERYQWRVPPTTGAYTVKPEGIIRGRQITMYRVQDWWGKNKKFFKHMNNVDQIVYNFIAEPSKAIELFRIGELDVLNITKPELWHERMEIPEVHNGYINRSTFYNIYPRPPYGLFLNVSKAPLNDRNVRLGLQHSLNIQNVIDTTFRGDYQRLNTYNSGYGKFSNPHIKAREYSPEQAREYFSQAGYTITSPDGILRKPDGTRLSIAVTFPNASPSLASILGKLKEDARRCGLELQLDPLDSTVSFRKVMEKRVQASFSAWGFSPPHPMNEQGFHSRHAYDDRGSPKPYTNNICCYANKEMDALLDAETNAETEDALQKATWAVQQKIYDEALWLPCWTAPFARLGYWRWVRWPNSETTKFSHPLVFDPMESYLYWIDPEIKKETLAAKRASTVFEEIDTIYDQYRYIDFSDQLESNSEQESNLPSVPAVPNEPNAVTPTDS